MTEAQQKEAEGLLAEFKGCHERVVSVIPVDPLGAKIVTETGKEFEVSGALAVPLRRPRNQQGERPVRGKHKPSDSAPFASGGIMRTEPPTVMGAYGTSGLLVGVRSEAPIEVSAPPDVSLPPPIVIRIAHTLVVPNPDKDV